MPSTRELPLYIPPNRSSSLIDWSSSSSRETNRFGQWRDSSWHPSRSQWSWHHQSKVGLSPLPPWISHWGRHSQHAFEWRWSLMFFFPFKQNNRLLYKKELSNTYNLNFYLAQLTVFRSTPSSINSHKGLISLKRLTDYAIKPLSMNILWWQYPQPSAPALS